MIFQIDIPIYNSNVLMFVEPTQEEFDELLSDENNRNKLTDEELENIFKELDGPYMGYTRRLSKGGQIMLLKEKSNPIYYVHELFHVANNVLQGCGVTLDEDGEAYAYLVGWLVNQYYNVVLLGARNKKESNE